MTELNASVVSHDAVSDEAAIVRIRPDSGKIPTFRPGQHISIGAVEDGVLMMRPYSIASAPDADYIEIYTQKAPHGRVHLAAHASGGLTLDEVPIDRDLLMIATGTGVAPFISIYRAFQAQNRWRSLTLVHGVRRERDLGYREELQAGRLRYVPVVSREAWPGVRGRVQAALDLSRVDRERTHAFLCGRGDMVASLEPILRGEGLAHVHMERYA